MPASRAISPGCGVNTSVRPLASFASSTGLAARMLSASASITAGILVAESRPVVNLTVSGSLPRPGPIASTVIPAVSAASASGARFSAAMQPARLAASGKVINSGAMAATSGSTGAAPAAVTSPAPARSAARDAIAGAPDLPTEPPTTSTCPKLPCWPPPYAAPA